MMKRLAALVGMGLLAACGQSGSNLSDVDNSLNVLDGEIPLVNEAASALNIASNESVNEAEPGSVIVGGLPLRLGFYVASKASCSEASNATITLIRRDGYSGSRYTCTFGAIEKIGSTTYRVTESCTEMPGFGTREEAQTSVRTYEVPGNETFSAKSDNGWANEARFCAQTNLPEPWRDNDISDAIGTAPAKKL
jgi:hypothetical protein